MQVRIEVVWIASNAVFKRCFGAILITGGKQSQAGVFVNFGKIRVQCNCFEIVLAPEKSAVMYLLVPISRLGLCRLAHSAKIGIG